MSDSLINIETGEIDWDSIKQLYEQTVEKSTDLRKLHCKKCNDVFYCKNYMGEYPLCDKHRNNTFKKK